MSRLLLAAPLLLLAGAAEAKIPFFNAVCPPDNQIHADKGGPVFVNGAEAKLKKVNDNYYEAKTQHLTISIAVNPDGSPLVSYTHTSGHNGICSVR